MKEECLVCKAPLMYLKEDEMMECVFCHKKQLSKTKCINGHYVCDDCHSTGIDIIIDTCLDQTSKNPYFIFEQLVSLPFCHMHGPEHHIIVGSSLLTAYKNSGGELELKKALIEMQSRGKQVPGGVCGFWGACGAAISSGIFVSIVTGSTPLKVKEWGLSNLITAKSLEEIGKIGGPRCCKRNSFLAMTSAIQFVKENFGIVMESYPIKCSHSSFNNQCIKQRCPFHQRTV